MKQSIVTVFGGTGYLGRVVAGHLAGAGCRVRIAARNPQAATIPEANGRIEYYRADVLDESVVASALKGADAAVNAVGLYDERSGSRLDAVHVDGAEHVARQAAAAGVTRLVHISGIGVETASESRYVRARAHGEQAVRAAFPDAAILRPSVLFGHDDGFRRRFGMLTRLPVVPLFGHGDGMLQPVHVQDVAIAVAAVIETPSAAGRVFELGGAGAYSYRHIVQAVLADAGRRRPLLPVPLPLWKLPAAAALFLPNPPLTLAQVALTRTDNVVGEDAATFADLNLEPRGLASVIPSLDDRSQADGTR